MRYAPPSETEPIEANPEDMESSDLHASSKYFLEKEVISLVYQDSSPSEVHRPPDLPLSLADLETHLNNPSSPIGQSVETCVRQKSSPFAHPETKFSLIIQGQTPFEGYQFLIHSEGTAAKLDVYEYTYDENRLATFSPSLATFDLKPPQKQEKSPESIFEEIDQLHPQNEEDIWTVLEQEITKKIPNFLERRSDTSQPSTVKEYLKERLAKLYTEIGVAIYPDGSTDYPSELIVFSMGELTEQGLSGSAVIPSSDIESEPRPVLLGLHEHPAKTSTLPLPSAPDLLGSFPAHPGRTEAIFCRLGDGTVRMSVFCPKTNITHEQYFQLADKYEEIYNTVGLQMTEEQTLQASPNPLFQAVQPILNQLFECAYFEFKDNAWQKMIV